MLPTRIGLAAMICLALLAPTMSMAQSGETPMLTSPEIVVYNLDSTTSPPTYHPAHGKNWWFGNAHLSGDTVNTYSIPQVDLEYGVLEPSALPPLLPGFANVTPNGHVVVSILSGGFRSSQFDTMMGPGAEGTNLARHYVREGYELVLVKHADALNPGNGDIQGRNPAFLPNDYDPVTGQDYGIFAQVHHAIRHVRSSRSSSTKIGATGTSSGGALAVSLLLAGGTGPDPAGNTIDAISSKIDAAVAGGLGLDLFNWRYPGDQAFFFQIPEYFVHPVLSGHANPYDPGYDYPPPPSDPIHVELYDTTPSFIGLGRHKYEHPHPNLSTRGPFPAWNWLPGASQSFVDIQGVLVDPEFGGTDPVSGSPFTNVQYPQLTQIPAPPPALHPSMMGTRDFLDDSSNPLLLSHGTHDGQVPYYQFGEFLSYASGVAPSFFADKFQPVGYVNGNHGGRDSDHERLLVELAWFRKHLLGRDDLDSDGLRSLIEVGDPTAVPPIVGIGTDPSDPDTDGDGMVDGAEAQDDGSPQLSDPLDPADGLRIIEVSRPQQNAIVIKSQEPAGHTFVIQTATNLNKLSADEYYHWEDLEYYFSSSGSTNQQIYVAGLPSLDPYDTNHAVFFRIRLETSDFDWISCDPVGISVVEIKRATSGSIRNYISPSLVGREARGKVVSTTIDTANNTADMNLAMPLAFDQITPLNNIQSLPASQKYVAIVIRDPEYAPERTFDNATTAPANATDYEIPLPDEAGMEGHWWLVTSSSGGTGGGGDTAVTVGLRTGGTDPTAIPVGSTIAIRQLSSLENVLGIIGGPESPFKVGDEIELYGPDGVVGRNGAGIAPVEVLEFTDPTPSTPGTATWIVKGSSPPTAIALSDRLLMPDEAFGYVAFQSQNGSSKAAMVGWVPMGDINAYMAPVASGDSDVTVIKNYPYPMDCPEQIFGVGRTGMGLVESGFAEDNSCFVKFPWPDGVGPPLTGPGMGVMFGDDGLTGSSSGELVLGAPSITRLASSNTYWVGPPDPAWYLRTQNPYFIDGSDDGYLRLLAEQNNFFLPPPNGSEGDPSKVREHFDGAVFPKGRGRCLLRVDLSQFGGSNNSNLIEWTRRRPYSWRL